MAQGKALKRILSLDELAGMGLLKCSRSVCSTSMVPCGCKACTLVNPSPRKNEEQLSGPQQLGTLGVTSATAEEADQVVCQSCGHDENTARCCKGKSQGSRAGERQRQAANRLRRDHAQREEAAVLRPRAILSIDEAQTPAQLAMARMRARIAKKPE